MLKLEVQIKRVKKKTQGKGSERVQKLKYFSWKLYVFTTIKSRENDVDCTSTCRIHHSRSSQTSPRWGRTRLVTREKDSVASSWFNFPGSCIMFWATWEPYSDKSPAQWIQMPYHWQLDTTNGQMWQVHGSIGPDDGWLSCVYSDRKVVLLE